MIKRPDRSLCPDCPFGGPRVGSRGNPEAPFAIVGESPGAGELRMGLPFVGPSGEVLFKTLPETFDAERDAYITNALLCYPRKKDPAKLAVAARACQQRLLSDVGGCKRKVILALGNAAVWALTGDFSSKITKVRGRPIENPLASSGIIPAVHPAALLRGTGSYRQFKEDCSYAFGLLSGMQQREPTPSRHVVCNTVVKVRAALKDLRKGEFIAADIETEGLDRQRHKILSLGFCKDPKLVYIIPARLIKYCKGFLQSKKCRFIWHNGKFDIAFLRRDGINARVDHDTMLLSYALDETGGIHDLEQIAGDLFSAPSWKHMIAPYLKNKKSLYSDIPPEILYEYQHYDISYTLQIFMVYRWRVHADAKLERLYKRTLIPSSELYYHVENNGILVDRVRLQANIDRLEKIAEDNLETVQRIAGYDINPSSPQQLAEYLFDHLKLRPKGRTGRSTAKDVLAKLPQIPFILAVGEYRKAVKAKSTYGTSIAKEIKDDGRVHTTVNIHGTRTGRPSSKEPNVFNVPRDEQIRGTYVADKGNTFIELDINQAELRSLAHCSRDEWLCSVYNDTGRSLHKEIAREFFGEDFNHEQYMRAKAVNFGIVYGRTGPSLDYEYDWEPGTGSDYIDRWFARMPQAHLFIKRCRAAPRKLQTITTVFGNKKRHQLVTKANLWNLQNEAANFPHQNIASNINLHGAIKLKPMLDSFGALIENLVYDSVLIECADDADTVRQIIKLGVPMMESVAPEWGITSVPFKVDAKVGHRWGSLSEDHEWLQAA